MKTTNDSDSLEVFTPIVTQAPRLTKPNSQARNALHLSNYSNLLIF